MFDMIDIFRIGLEPVLITLTSMQQQNTMWSFWSKLNENEHQRLKLLRESIVDLCVLLSILIFP